MSDEREGSAFISDEALERIRNEWSCGRGHVWRKDWSEKCPYCAKAADAIEIERLQALFDGRWKDAAEAHLKSAGPGPDGTFEFNIQAGIVPLIAAHLAALFKAGGAENYIEVEVNHEEIGPLLLTMRRWFGKMPSTVAAEERARADAAEAKLAQLERPISLVDVINGLERAIDEQGHGRSGQSELVHSAGLIIAEIERLDRAAARTPNGGAST